MQEFKGTPSSPPPKKTATTGETKIQVEELTPNFVPSNEVPNESRRTNIPGWYDIADVNEKFRLLQNEVKKLGLSGAQAYLDDDKLSPEEKQKVAELHHNDKLKALIKAGATFEIEKQEKDFCPEIGWDEIEIEPEPTFDEILLSKEDNVERRALKKEEWAAKAERHKSILPKHAAHFGTPRPEEWNSIQIYPVPIAKDAILPLPTSTEDRPPTPRPRSRKQSNPSKL